MQPDPHLIERATLAEKLAALSQRPDDPLLLEETGDLLVALDRGRDALAHFEAAAACDPSNPRLWRKIGSAAARAGLHAQARPALETALALEYDARAEAALCRTLACLGEAELSLRHGWHALDHVTEPEWRTVVYTALADTYRQSGNGEEAIRYYLDALVLDPASPYSEHHLASLYAARGEFHAALEHGQRAAELHPSDCVLWTGVGYSANRLGQHDLAKQALWKALAIDEDDPAALRELAYAHQSLDEYDEAISCAQRALPVHHEPGDRSGLHGMLAHCLAAKGELEASLRERREAVRENPRDAVAQYNLGIAYLDAEHPAEALGHFSTADALDPSDAACRVAIGHAFVSLGRWTDAEALLRELLDPENPGDADVLLTEAEVALGHAAEAQVRTRAQVCATPQSGIAWVALATALRAYGDESEADAALRQAQILAPDDPWVVFATEASG